MESLIIIAVVLFVVVMLIGNIYHSNKRTEFREKLNDKTVTYEDINKYNEYFQYGKDSIEQAHSFLQEKEQVEQLERLKKELDERREREKKELEGHIERQKKEAIILEKENKEVYDADKYLSQTLELLESLTNKCNKCDNGRHRVWQLTSDFLELRCETCKSKYKYFQTELKGKGFEMFHLQELIEKIERFRKRESIHNSYIRKNILTLDFNGKRENSPDYYEFAITPKNNSTILPNNEGKKSRRITQDVKDKVWNRDGGKCVECDSNENLEFDHIIPHSKGGANTYRNIQLLCEPCNRSKSAKIG